MDTRALRPSIDATRSGPINVISALAVSVILSTIAAVDCSAMELLVNGSFEMPSPIGWDDGPGIRNDLGFAREEYDFYADGRHELGPGIEFPTGIPEGFTGSIQPLGSGGLFGQIWGRENIDLTEPGSSTQIVSLEGISRSRYEFSAWIASTSRDDYPDYAIVSIEFFEEPFARGSSLGSIVFDGSDQTSPYIVGSLNIDGLPDPMVATTEDNWTFYRARGTIPSLAKSAAVVIQGAAPPDSGSTGRFSYVDLVSLQVIPEPSGIVLAVISTLLIPLAIRQKCSKRAST